MRKMIRGLKIPRGEGQIGGGSATGGGSAMGRVNAGHKLSEGEMRVLDIDGTKVSIAAAGGSLYAFDDVCTHMGCSLGEGKLEGTTMTCPCHGSQFDVTSGAVIRGPAQRPVRVRSVQIEGDDLLVES